MAFRHGRIHGSSAEDELTRGVHGPTLRVLTSQAVRLLLTLRGFGASPRATGSSKVLSQVAETLLQPASQEPTASLGGKSQAGVDPLDLLAQLPRRTDEAAGAIGSYADDLAIPGAIFERYRRRTLPLGCRKRASHELILPYLTHPPMLGHSRASVGAFCRSQLTK